MQQFVINGRINNAETGEFIEKVRLIFTDENDEFKDEKALYDWLEESECIEEVNDFVEALRIKEIKASDVITFEIVKLKREKNILEAK
jgi:hypothetical protein